MYKTETKKYLESSNVKEPCVMYNTDRGRVEETDKRVGFRCVTKDIIYSSTLSQYSIYDISFLNLTIVDRNSYIWL